MDPDGSATGASGRPDLQSLAARRLGDYLQLWEQATRKMLDRSYRSEDLIDDWFALWGKVARDLTTGAALVWRASDGVARRSGGEPHRSGN